MSFTDRTDAGRLLGGRLGQLRGRDVVVLGLPRGGVPVAAEVARALGAPLDVVIVRKLGVPSQPELAVGAVGEDGALVVNERVARRVHLSEAEFAEMERRGREEVQRRAWWSASLGWAQPRSVSPTGQCGPESRENTDRFRSPHQAQYRRAEAGARTPPALGNH